jgi:hypothetical protein
MIPRIALYGVSRPARGGLGGKAPSGWGDSAQTEGRSRGKDLKTAVYRVGINCAFGPKPSGENSPVNRQVFDPSLDQQETIVFKIAAVISTVLVSLGLAGFTPEQGPGRDDPPLAKAKAKAKGKGEAKKKGEAGPKGDLKKAYDLLRRLRAYEGSTNRPEERIRDWTERASKYYRDGLKSLDAGDDFLAHEYGAIAHDLARAADHAHNAALFDRRDPELPPPSAGFGPDDSAVQVRRDLNRAYDRITELERGEPAPGAGFYLKAARDLYTAARRDVEAGREERGGELARAAEALTHVAEHLGHAAEGSGQRRGPEDVRRAPVPPPDRPGPGPEAKRGGRRESDLPPPLPPR